MRFGYWTPVYGGFLRNIEDEGMPPRWDYIKRISTQADRLGFDLTLVPELYLNDRKGPEAPSLEAWSLATAIAAVTDQIEVLTAIRPGYHNPQVTAKRLSTLADISGDRLSLNVVAAWWAEEAKQFGGVFPSHDDRYVHCREFVDALRGLLTESPYSQHGEYFDIEGTVVEPKPARLPQFYAGGESEGGREAIAGFADSYVTHGGTIEEIRKRARNWSASRRSTRTRRGMRPSRSSRRTRTWTSRCRSASTPWAPGRCARSWWAPRSRWRRRSVRTRKRD